MSFHQILKKKNKKYVSFLIWIVALVFIGALIGNITQPGVDVWYSTLHRSPLTPANYVFGIVWTILYIMLAISGWAIWSSTYSNLALIKIAYILQLILNWSWAPLFFLYHQPGIALLCIGVIVALTLVIIFKTYHTLPLVSYLFMPYFVWVSFALYLNFYIWLYN